MSWSSNLGVVNHVKLLCLYLCLFPLRCICILCHCVIILIDLLIYYHLIKFDNVIQPPLALSRSYNIESLKAIKLQTPKIKYALYLVEASDEIKKFEFLLGKIILYDILFAITIASKFLLYKNMNIDIAIIQLQCLVSFSKKYRVNEFISLILSIEEIANEINEELNFHEKHVMRRKK